MIFQILFKIFQIKPNVLYLNSFFDFYFSIIPNLFFYKSKKIKVILSPRGEFNLSALSQKKNKKKIYILISKYFNFYKNTNWFFTNEEEKSNLINSSIFFNNKYEIMQNIPFNNKKYVDLKNYKKNKNKLKILFVGRIAKMKNLIFCLDILSKINFKFIFDIYGPIDDISYWNKFNKTIIDYNLMNSVRYKSELNHQELQKKYLEYDILFMPSLGENFGHSIYESLAFGLPVIISDKTNFKYLKNHEVGFDIPLNDIEGFIDAFNYFHDLDNEQILNIKSNCILYAKNYFSQNVSKKKIIDKFNRVLKN